MIFQCRTWYAAAVSLLAMLMLQGCASMGGASGSNNIRLYDQSFEEMARVVERAIKGSSFNIAHVNESDPDRLILMVAREAYMRGERVQQEQGSVRVQRMEDGRTQVEIENPDYHFSVPDNQRIKYRRILFNRIDSLVN